MQKASRNDGASFSWPPTTSDLATIDVMDCSTEAGVPVTRRDDPPATAARRSWRRRNTPGAGRLVLLGISIMVGLGLPDIAAQFSLPAADIGVAHATSATSPDAERLLAMQALLRGDPAKADGRDVATDASRAAEVPWTAPAEVPMVVETRPTTTDHTAAIEPDAEPVAGAPEAAAAAASPVRPRWSRSDPYTAPVREAVLAFEAAWSRLDTAATRDVWPSANPTTLTSAFTAMREQRLRLAPCDVERTGNRATASCEGTLRYRPRVGDHTTRVRRDTWDFTLERSTDGWVVTDLDTAP